MGEVGHEENENEGPTDPIQGVAEEGLHKPSIKAHIFVIGPNDKHFKDLLGR